MSAAEDAVVDDAHRHRRLDPLGQQVRRGRHRERRRPAAARREDDLLGLPGVGQKAVEEVKAGLEAQRACRSCCRSASRPGAPAARRRGRPSCLGRVPERVERVGYARGRCV